MYGTAARTFFANYPLFLTVALLFAAIEAIGFDINLGVTIVVYGLIALYSHRMVLLGETYGWTGGPKLAEGQRMPIFAFLWRYGLFFLIFLGGLFIFVMPEMKSVEAGEVRLVSAVLAGMLVVAPVFAVILALFGTTLPAVAVHGDGSFLRALGRGRRRFFPTLGRLAVGPALITVLNLALAVYLLGHANSAVSEFAISAFLFFIGFIPTHLTAVALSLAYRETEAA